MSVDVVAVDVDPTVWAIECTICGGYVGESTTNDEVIDRKYEEHCALHGLSPEN